MGVPRYKTPAFTLIEMILAVAVMTVLLGGMASAILVASHALPDSSATPDYRAAAAEAVERISRDLVLATSISVSDPDDVQFSVPDRGHAAAGPESIEYSWSGTPGDPLVHRYNGGAALPLYADVQVFSLEYVRQPKPFSGSLSVLMMVDDDAALTAQEVVKRSTIESWGFTVQVISDHKSLAEQETAAQSASVIYLVQDALTTPALVGTNPAVGIVCEESALFPDVGISEDSYYFTDFEIDILDNSHEITQPFPVGLLTILSTGNECIAAWKTHAPGASILAEDPDNPNGVLCAIDAGGVLFGGATAAGRRVSLPWGDRNFDFNNVNEDGLTLMKRALVWAAAPSGVASVRITLQLGTEPSGRAERQVQLLNLPDAP